MEFVLLVVLAVLAYFPKCVLICRDVLWPDQWTAVTYDGSRSAQFEHTILVTETGCELLTARVGAPTDQIVWDRETFQR
jgi:hypothetical protein